MDKKKYLILGGVLLLLAVGFIGFTYAYWVITKEQTNTNIVNSDCFDIEFQEGNAINLNNVFPITDADGLKLVPYTFTITNKCSSWASFQINLETMEQTGVTVLPDRYLKVDLQEDSSSKITTKLDKSLHSKLDTSTTITGATEAYKLLTGTLKSEESKTFNLRIWMDGDVTAESEDSMNASYQGKVSITFGYQENPFAESGTLMAAGSSNTAFWGYKESITKVVIEPEMAAKAIDLAWDVSESQDGSVMSYLIMNVKADASEADSYTLYLQSKGGIKANEDSSSLFYNFNKLKSIEGLEYFDTSNVIDMENMFAGCSSLTNLDVSYFETSKVINMSSMFLNCGSLTSLNLSNFDTSNVGNMENMFAGCSILTSLGVSHFDTKNVIRMVSMFFNCSSLTNLDVSHFDTSNVIDMENMFAYCSSLTNLDLGNFDTSKVTSMGGMFFNCSSLTNLDVSHFDTSNVIYMHNMFFNCSSLTNLDVSHFDTSNVTNMKSMFSFMPITTIVKVKDEATQNWVLTSDNGRPSEWNTSNVIIKTA